MFKCSSNYPIEKDHPLDSLMPRSHWIVSSFFEQLLIIILALFLGTTFISYSAVILITLIKIVFFVGSNYFLNIFCDELAKKHSLWIELASGKYAAVMYFHGYLKKILPVSESHYQPELAERIKLYGEIQKVEVPIKKLLILCPKSGQDEPIIGKNSDMIDKRKGLEPLVLNRAGETRQYNNSMYKVFLDEKLRNRGCHVTVSTEYATPLSTLASACERSMFNDKNLKEAMINIFYNELYMLLEENQDCGKYCELVRYDDKVMDGVTALRKRVLELLAECKYDITAKPVKLLEDRERSLENDQVRQNTRLAFNKRTS